MLLIRLCEYDEKDGRRVYRENPIVSNIVLHEDGRRLQMNINGALCVFELGERMGNEIWYHRETKFVTEPHRLAEQADASA